MWLTRLALRNPILILMVSLMVIVLGGFSLQRLSVDLFPPIDIPVIRVVTFYSGAGPVDIEKSITQPIERAVASSPGIDRVESTSKQGASIVSVWFNYGTNLDSAQFEVSQRVAQSISGLPPGIQQPFILKFDVTNIPVVQVVVRGEGLDEKQLLDLASNVIEPQLERLPGVAGAVPGGGKQREISVRANRDKLRARSLGILDVVSAVKGANLILPSGSLRAGDLQYNVFTNTEVEEPRELESVIVRAGAAGQAPVRLGDLAEVEDASVEQANIVRVNGQRGVYLRIFKQPGANTIAVVDSVRAALPRLTGVPESVKLDISFDQSTYIRSAVSALQHEALQGGLLAVIVILVFLTSFRATGIVSVAIPLSIVATFVLMFFWGLSLNVFTLGGLALGVGRLVDDSIVELENIHRHLGQTKDRKKAVLDAAQEVAMPIFVSTLTTVIVFFPVLFLTGVARNLFVPLALTITFALVMSFFVSRTVTPLLCLSWLKSHVDEVQASKKSLGAKIVRLWDRMDDAYARALGVVLRFRFLFSAGILGAFLLSLLLFKKIGTEFFPDADEAQVMVVYRGPIGTRVERTEAVAERLEAATRKALVEDGKPIYATMLSDNGLPSGRTAIFTANSGPHSGNLMVNLVPKGARKLTDVAAMEKLRAELAKDFPGVRLFLSTGGIVKRILNFGAPAPIDVEVLGQDFEIAQRVANGLADKMRGLKDAQGRPVLTDVQVSREENYPELDVTVDREKAGMLGISEQQIAQTVLTSITGNTAFSPLMFTDPKTGNEYFVNVRLEDAHRTHVSDLSELFVRAPSGAVVELGSMARIERKSGPVTISRKYLSRIVDVTANVAPTTDLGTAGGSVEGLLAEERPPEGFSVQLGGQVLAQKQAFAGLGFAALLAIALVYMVLAAQFKSLVDPLVIMFSVPLGITGVAIMLWATKTTLSVNSAMGVIMMVGIVVSNGVLLVDFANVLRRRGMPIREATIEAAKTRLRPILMTTLATIVGLVPMAVGIGEGSETNLPLARAVIGGLTVSTVFTLFLIPSLYTLLDKLRRNREMVLVLSVALVVLACSPARAEDRPTLALDLKTAVDRALARNPQAAAAEADLKRAAALVAEARAAALPTLVANGTYTHLDDDRVLGDRVISAQNQLSGNLVLTVPIVAPRAWTAWRTAEAQRRVAEAGKYDVRQRLALSVARTYLSALAQSRVVAAQERARDVAAIHAKDAATRFTGGLGNKLDAIRAEQAHADATRAVSQQRVALAKIEEALAVLVGADGPVLPSEEPRLEPAPDGQAALRDIDANRKDVQALRERVRAAERTSRESYADFLPQLNGVAQPFYQAPPTLTQPRTGWQAQLVLSLPLYDGGLRYGLKDGRDALAERARVDLDATLRQARSDVRLAFESMRSADEQLQAARKSADLARQVVDLSTQAYRAGATTNLEVVDAERRAQDAETQVAVSEDAARQARLDLLAATGRFP